MVSITQEAVGQVREAPEYPGKSLLMGAATEMKEDPLAMLLRAHRHGGDVVRFRLGPINAMLIANPRDILRVHVENHRNYNKQTRGYQMLRLLLRNGLVTSEGEFWLKQRRTIQPAFSKERVTGFSDVMTQAAADMGTRWEEDAREGRVTDVLEDMTAVTLRIAGLTLFSKDLAGEAQHVGEALTTAQRYVDHRIANLLAPPAWVPTSTNRGYNAARTTLLGLVNAIIDERRQKPASHADLLGMLMDAQDPVTGERMSNAQLLDEALTILMAGHETTAMTLTWTLYRLSAHPDVARRVRAELAEVLGGRIPTLADLPRLPYLDAVMKESMRLHPPVWILDRTAEADDVLGGFRVPKGTMVVTSPYVTHRHPAFWRNPEGFDPDRWFTDEVKALPRMAYFPFSAGQRKCIGDFFALMEAPLILGTLLQKFAPELEHGHPVEGEPLVTLRPRHGMRMLMRRAPEVPGAKPTAAPVSSENAAGCPFHAGN